MYKVQKKDGSTEDFDRNKIINGVLRSGGTEEEAEKVAGEIEAWLPTAADNEVVKASDIRVRLLEVLKEVNPTAAASFEAYKKPVDTPAAA